MIGCMSREKIRKALIICLSLGGFVCLVVVLMVSGLEREIARDRQWAERAVVATVEKLARFELSSLSVQAITNFAVAPAAVQVLDTNPIQFRVEASTGWPD